MFAFPQPWGVWRQGVETVIVTAGSLEESTEAQRFLAKNASNSSPVRLVTTVGVHPTRCLEFTQGGPDGESAGEAVAARVAAHVAALRSLAIAGSAGGGVVALGELGLDLDRLGFCPAEEQRRGFQAQLAIAEETGLPLFLHCRNAGPEMAAFLGENRARFKAKCPLAPRAPRPQLVPSVHIVAPRISRCCVHVRAPVFCVCARAYYALCSKQSPFFFSFFLRRTGWSTRSTARSPT